MKRWKAVGQAWAWTGAMGLIAVVDLVLRWRQAVLWTPAEFVLYALSVAYALLWLRLVHWALAGLWERTRWAFWAAVLALQGVLTFELVLHFNHYMYFGIAPELLSFTELFSAPDDTLRAVRSGFTPVNLALLFGLTLAFGWTWRFGQPPADPAGSGKKRGARPGWKRVAIAGGLTLVLTPPFFNNVYQGRGNFLPSVNFTFLMVRAAHVQLTGEHLLFLPVANRNQLPRVDRAQPYNVLFLLGESMRYSNVSYDGYARDTTPYEREFLARFPRQSFVFHRAYTSTIRTNPSVPSVISGVHPLEFPEKLIRSPLLYKYGKVFPGTRTFVLSAQSYSDYNYVNFFRSPLLDDLVYQENSGKPAFSWDGMDDAELLPFLKRNLDAAGNGRFFGVLHLNGTHFPYLAPSPFQPWKEGGTFDDYDNSIFYLDRTLHFVLDELERRNLLENTVILSTSDHGEAFGEHGRSGHAHGYPYEELTHIPAWLYLPRPLAEKYGDALRVNTNRNVSNLDWVPTLVDLLGLGEVPEIRAIMADLLGTSLLKPVDPARVLAVQNDRVRALKVEGFGLIQGTYRFLYHPSGGVRLFDLATDPQSHTDLWVTKAAAEGDRWREVTMPFPELRAQVDGAITATQRMRGAAQTAVAAPTR